MCFSNEEREPGIDAAGGPAACLPRDKFAAIWVRAFSVGGFADHVHGVTTCRELFPKPG